MPIRLLKKEKKMKRMKKVITVKTQKEELQLMYQMPKILHWHIRMKLIVLVTTWNLVRVKYLMVIALLPITSII